jgi:hypothetical protein
MKNIIINYLLYFQPHHEAFFMSTCSVKLKYDIVMLFYQLMQLPLAKDVDLDAIARIAEGFSGADLQALLSDAQLAAVHELLGSADANEPNRKPVITDALLKSTASKARPSVSETEKLRLYSIYGEFLGSKRSVAAQVSLSLSLHFFLVAFVECCDSKNRLLD